MYPGTDFPGNDLYAAEARSPEECAARCVGDRRCKAFTFSIPDRRCMIKWAASRFDGSLSAVSGVIDTRPIVPPGGTGAGAVAPAPVIVLPAGPPPTCSAPGNPVCAGCSITCAPGQQASCREGEVHDTTCWTAAKCECRGAGPAPPSVYTPGPGGGANTNSCVEQDRFACKGCSASCPPDQSPVCTPSIPGDNNTCHAEAWCRCVKG